MLWQDVRDAIHAAFAEEGYDDVRAEHMAVLQHPGPDGQRPSTLAARAGMSRQAINHLISHLERAGYLERYTDPADRNARLVRLTERGRKLMQRMEAIAASIEREWAREIGARRLDELRATLADLGAARQRQARRLWPVPRVSCASCVSRALWAWRCWRVAPGGSRLRQKRD
ncbi:MAG: MarR family transcriptional regulator [Streptosporangiaceae bacterium]|nr:MarR family transcriptional regulator [Streptosporangiaceae bacterium]